MTINALSLLNATAVEPLQFFDPGAASFPLSQARMHDVPGAAGPRLSLHEGMGSGRARESSGHLAHGPLPDRERQDRVASCGDLEADRPRPRGFHGVVAGAWGGREARAGGPPP